MTTRALGRVGRSIPVIAALALATGAGGAAFANPAHAAGSFAGPSLPPQIQHQLNGVDGLSANDVWAVGTQCHGPCDGFFENKTWIQHYDGTSWTHVASFTDAGQAETLEDVAEVAPNDVWVVGEKVAQSGGTLHDVIQHWDGTAWTSTPARGNGVSAVAAVASDDIWAVGNLKIAHWDGTSWQDVSFEAPPKSRFSSFDGVTAIASDDAWAVGSYQDTKFAYHPLAEHWDGTSWSYVPTPAPSGDSYLASVSGSSSDLWAVGEQDFNTGTLAEHWDGTSWQQVAMPTHGVQNPQMTSVSAISATDVWAVGWNEPAGDDTALLEHWDGVSWTVVSSPQSSGSADLWGVFALSSSDVWAVGSNKERRPHALHEHWDGQTWTID